MGLKFFRPCRGSLVSSSPVPTARAVGNILPPLPGLFDWLIAPCLVEGSLMTMPAGGIYVLW